METKDVPKAALRFSVGEFELGDNGEGAKSAPFRMVARSGKPIEHWYWGNVVHDLSGMRLHKQRIPIDYAHDEREVIGYANNFDGASGDLVVSGALVPFKESDRATEIIHKQKAGVPYEASINFGGDGIKLERVPEGTQFEVNGYTFKGPGVIIREWPLRGIAVCPYGADANTSTTFSQSEQITVEVVDMSDTEITPEVETTQPVPEVEAQATVESADRAVNDTVEAEAVDATLTARAAEGKRFLDAFGQEGAVWFSEGKSFDEARDLFMHSLLRERDELRTKLAAVRNSGEAEPVAFSEGHAAKKPYPVIRIQGQKYDY